MRSKILFHPTLTFASALTAALLLAAACGEDEDTDHEEEEDPTAEICEHMQEGPFVDVTTSSAAAGAPDATHEHTAVTVTLTQGGGFVSYEADAAGEFLIGLSQNVALKVRQNGQEVDVENATPATLPCSDLKTLYEVDLAVGAATLEFGPSSVTELKMVVEESSHAGHEH